MILQIEIYKLPFYIFRFCLSYEVIGSCNNSYFLYKIYMVVLQCIVSRLLPLLGLILSEFFAKLNIFCYCHYPSSLSYAGIKQRRLKSQFVEKGEEK